MLFSPSFVAVAATLLSTSTVHAHMKIATPVPFNPDALNNSPLAADGSDFPCKFGGSYAAPKGAPVPPENMMAIGEEQTLSFIGSAVHGGGSCQLSLTTDKVPTKNSVWKVIHSIEGGCPSSVDGNLPEDPYGTGASTFKFKIPSGIAPGDYTFAWTWLNRIGNREFYMNCAPITVTGAKKRRYTPTAASEPASKAVSLAKRDDLPEMFVANINGCTTKEGVDIRFPKAGPSVDLFGALANLLSPGEPVCTMANGQAGPSAGEGGSTGGSGGNGGDAPKSYPSAPQPTPSKTAPTVSPGVFATQPASPPAKSPPAKSPVVNPAPSAAPAKQSPGQGSGSAQTGPCQNEGEWNCIGGTSFQRCASGQWSVAMAVSAGTQCTPGTGAELSIAAVKRNVGAIHRRRGHQLS